MHFGYLEVCFKYKIMEENQLQAEGSLESVGKKRKANKNLWIRNKMKHARLKGEEYVDYKGKTVPAKTTGSACR